MTNLKGGKFIGRGSSGCAFSPPLANEVDNSKMDVEHIGKAMTKKNAEMEYMRVQEFLKADPEQLYGVYASPPLKLGNAKDIIESAGGIAEIYKCNYEIIPNEYSEVLTHELIMPRANTDLYSMLKLADKPDADLFLKHLTCFENLVDGLAVYAKNSLCHLDIKHQNVVCFGNYENPHKYKFIDFDLSEQLKSLLQPLVTQYTALSNIYFPYPLVANVWFSEKLNFRGGVVLNTKLSKIVSAFNENLKDVCPFIILNPDTSSMLRSDMENIANTYNFGGSFGFKALTDVEAEVFRSLIGFGTDVYSLGLLMAYIAHKMLGVVFRENVHVETFNSLEDDDFMPYFGDLLYDMLHFRIRAVDLPEAFRNLLAKKQKPSKRRKL